MTVFEILKKLENTSSRKEKEAILESEKDNEILKEVIKMALNPHLNFFIRKIPKYAFTTEELSLQDAVGQLSVLSGRALTGNAAINFLADLLSKCSEENAYVIERIIEKDLKCGVSYSTANKVFGKNFVREYPVMLCEKFEKKLVDKLPWSTGVRVDLKEDGMRVNVTVKGHDVTFVARSGKPIETHGVLDEHFIRLATAEYREYGTSHVLDITFDGELLVVDDDGLFMSRKAGNGICNKAIKGTITKAEASRFRVSLWDAISTEYLESEVFGLPLKKREEVLTELYKQYATGTVGNALIYLTAYQYVNSYAEAEKIFNDYLELGKEGVILKDPNSHWEAKRSNSFIKMKAEKTCELKVTGTVEGTGKYQGMLGALTCETECGKLVTSVGSGFSDSQRKANWEIGSIIEVKYNEVIQDKHGNYSLFLPIFQKIRLDKTSANTFEELS